MNKHRRHSNKIRHHPSTLKRSSSKCQQKEKGSMMKRYKLQKEIKIKDNKGEVPKAMCFLSVGKTISKTFGTYHKLIHGFAPFFP